MMIASKDVTILLVEDDDGDVKLVERAFKKANISNPFLRAIDGIDALEILRGAQATKTVRRPFILFVDLNMPRMNGLSLVKALREDPELSDSIVFILTTSKLEDDKNAAYDLNVAGYIQKENAGYDFLNLIELIGGYTRLVELP